MASYTKKEEVTMETRFEKMETRLDEMSNHLAKQDARHEEMMAFLRQSLEENKNRVNAVESKQQQATDEQREHLVLLRENRTSTELYRAEVQGANQRVEMMQDNLDEFRTDLQADARRHELQVDAAVKQIQAHHTASSLADTIGRHDLDTTPPGSVYGATPGEADQDAVRVGAHRPLEESKEEPATPSHYYQSPGVRSLQHHTVSVGTPTILVETADCGRRQIAPSYRSIAMIDPWLPPPWHTACYICI